MHGITSLLISLPKTLPSPSFTPKLSRNSISLLLYIQYLFHIRHDPKLQELDRLASLYMDLHSFFSKSPVAWNWEFFLLLLGHEAEVPYTLRKPSYSCYYDWIMRNIDIMANHKNYFTFKQEMQTICGDFNFIDFIFWASNMNIFMIRMHSRDWGKFHFFCSFCCKFHQ